MTSFTYLLSNLSTHLTQIILAVIVIAILVMVLMIVFTSNAVQHEVKKKVPPPMKMGQDDPPPHPEDMGHLPPIGGRLSAFLSLKGFFNVGDISLVFLRALNLLRERLDTVHYKYQLPWYLLIGANQSGKTTLMDRSEIVLPIGKPDLGNAVNPEMNWWFLNHGIILDIKGQFFIDKEDVKADEKGWKTVIALLNRYRSRRPIDGIILTIPATEIYGAQKLSLEEITDRAKFMAQKLRTTQHMLGLRLPVYVVISKSDVLPGFQSFCQSIPIGNRQNMLGWSSTYHPGTAFSPTWVDEAFGHLQNNLNQLRLEILASGASPETRDGVFIFPYELDHIVNPVKIYLNHIFKVSSYDEDLILRGLYLAGDSGVNIEFGELSANDFQTSPLSTLSTEDNLDQVSAKDLEETIKLTVGDLERDHNPLSVNPLKIFFFGDVLMEKVFKETGLAQPIHQRLIRLNRNLLLAKTSVVALTAVGTLGLLHGYERLSANRDYLLPVLGKINTLLHEVPASRLDESYEAAALFDKQTRQLLDMMNNLEDSNFFSLFIPSSWFSPVDNNLRGALKASYDHVILRTIYMDLLLKARNLLTLKPTDKDVTTSLSVQLQPTETVEYKLLKDYVAHFIQLHQYIEKYNLLSDSTDPTILKDLVEYALNIELPTGFLNNYMRFQRILKEVNYPKIDLNPYKKASQETLQNLYKHFLNDLISPSNANSIVGKMNTILKEVKPDQDGHFPDLGKLRSISQHLNKSVNSFGKPGDNWIDKAYFDPGPDFSDLMTEISGFAFFGPQMVHQFAAETAKTFHDFQTHLKDFNKLLIGGHDDHTSYPSQGLIAVQTSLADLFKQSFMNPTGDDTIIMNVAENQVVYWNPKLIERAIQENKKFETFVSKNLADYPEVLRENIKQIARNSLHSTIAYLIAKAQVVSTISGSGATAAEETLHNKIANTRDVAPKFLQLLNLMTTEGVGTGYVAFRNFLGTLATRLLDQVDQVLHGEGLYRVKDSNFNWWDGQTSPILGAFNVRDEQDLKATLERQRQMIHHLAMDYATPMVAFLSDPIMEEFNGNRTLLEKWTRILDQVKKYDAKNPDNTLSALEIALEVDLLNLDLKRCFTEIPLDSIKSNSGDFFASRLLQIRRLILSRCEVLKRHESITKYTNLQTFFDNNLKEHFPFSAKASANTPEADPEDIRQFFQMYKDAGDDPKVILDQIYQLGLKAEPAVSFLKSLEPIKAFFSDFLKSSPGELPSFNFKVRFRVNRAHENSGNLIIDYFVTPNDAMKLSNYDKSPTGVWTYGDIFTIGFTWPQAAPVQPYSDPSQPILTVDDHTATFAYPGKWSLFWMLKLQQATQSDYSAMENPNPYVLRFVIPNSPTEKTVVYDNIVLLSASKDGKSGKPIQLPQFPADAPPLDDIILNNADEPVIVRNAIGKTVKASVTEETKDVPEKTAVKKEGKKAKTKKSQASEEKK